MTHHWGRTDAVGTWPNPKPMRTLAALLRIDLGLLG